jgi:hypothetical protein
MEDLLQNIKDNLVQAKIHREKLSTAIKILEDFGESTGTAKTDLHNLDVKIAKQEQTLLKYGVTI